MTLSYKSGPLDTKGLSQLTVVAGGENYKLSGTGIIKVFPCLRLVVQLNPSQ
ncbi:MAG: hypothetical protein WA117_07555 [Verrucomicrobiia bacterium]